MDNSSVPIDNKDRFIKLGIFLPSLFANFRTAINPGCALAIDESLLAYKGRLSFKQYNPLKRARFGIKLFFMAEAASGFILNVLPYHGKSTHIENDEWTAEFGVGGATVLTLLRDLLGKAHRVTIDNWFMSVKLARKLLEQETYVIGTVKKTRKEMPKFGNKIKVGESETYSDGNILVERYFCGGRYQSVSYIVC